MAKKFSHNHALLENLQQIHKKKRKMLQQTQITKGKTSFWAGAPNTQPLSMGISSSEVNSPDSHIIVNT